jgi:hypothetical protein
MKPPSEPRAEAVARAIALAEAALGICDDQGFLYAAIDLSSALDKLQALREEHAKD